MIRLVVSDIDGTLFDKDEILDEEAIKLVQRLYGQGILFSLATGRVECMANHLADKLGLRIPYVACNGATIVLNGKAIYRRQVRVEALMELISEADLCGCTIIYSQDGIESVWRETPYILRQREKFDRYGIVHQIGKIEAKAVYLDKLTILDENSTGSILRLESTCRVLGHEYGYTRYGDRAIEIVHSSATKATGVGRLAKMLAIGMDEVLFIGDHQNDIQLISEAGIGVAVANSTDDVKLAADYVCSKGHMAGVVEAVERFCFGEKA
jgi:Cof subfamily protein (haloacid dehalogenase superfamily)